MNQMLLPLLAAIGIAAPAGLNVYLVLLIVGLMARIFGVPILTPPLDALSNSWLLVGLGLVLTLDIFLSKAPQVSWLAERIGAVARPLGGAVAALAVTSGSPVEPLAAGLVGFVVAGLVHWLGATVRRAVAGVGGGQAVPLASLLTDMVAALGAILALRAPVAGGIVGLLIVASLAMVALMLRRRPADSSSATPT